MTSRVSGAGWDTPRRKQVTVSILWNPAAPALGRDFFGPREQAQVSSGELCFSSDLSCHPASDRSSPGWHLPGQRVAAAQPAWFPMLPPATVYAAAHCKCHLCRVTSEQGLPGDWGQDCLSPGTWNHGCQDECGAASMGSTVKFRHSRSCLWGPGGGAGSRGGRAAVILLSSGRGGWCPPVECGDGHRH